MTNDKFTLITVVFMVIAIIGVVGLAAHIHDKHRAACEQRGGVYFDAHGGWLCLNPEALK